MSTAGWAQDGIPMATATVEDLSLEELMNVKVTTVSRQESTVGESPAAVFVVTQEMIQRSGATTIPELFRMVPGVEVARIDSNKWAISIRGFNNRLANKLLVQIDGRTVYNPIYSGVYWETVDYPLEDIDRIEVVRGPGASVWGANAVNGIINIITKSAQATQGTHAELLVGDEEHAQTAVRHGDKLGSRGFYRVYGKGYERDGGFHANGDENDDWRGAQAGFRYDRPLTEGKGFTLQGDWFRTDAGQRNNNVDINNPPTFNGSDTADENAKGGNILARWTMDKGKGASWTLQTYYDRFERTLRSGYADFDIDTFDVDLQRQQGMGDRHRLVYGLGYRLQKVLFIGSGAIDGGYAIGPARTDVSRDTLSAFIQDEMKLQERLTLTLGSKFERNDYTGFEYQPTARLLWARSKKQSAWAAVSRAVRTPSLLENDISLGTAPQGGNAFVLTPNANLVSETVIAYELGYRTQTSAHLALDGTVFYNVYDDLAAFTVGAPAAGPVPGTTTIPAIYNNGLNGRTYGAELAAQYNPTPRWRMNASYTYLHGRLHSDVSVPVAFRAPLEAAVGQNPRHQFSVRSSHDLSHDLQVDIMGRYVDSLPAFTPDVPSYVAFDARLAWKPKPQVELAIVGQNLFDSHHLEMGSGATATQVERGLYGKVTYKW